MIDKQNFSLLLKPVSADCNLNCTYCFYLKRRALYPDVKKHRMSAKTLEIVIKSYLSTHQPVHVFCWQGGEPALAGIDFYRMVIDLQRKYAPSNGHIINTLQTNAVPIDDAFGELLGRWKFLVGVSLDGPQDIHDRYRKYGDGTGTHADVMAGIDRLRKDGVDINILTMVTDANVGRGKEVYRYLRDTGFLYHQYIPCVEYDEHGNPAPFTVSADAWGRFLCDVFEEWTTNDIRTVSVRLFDSIIAYLVNGMHDNCQMGKNCAQYFVVEYNGDIYPCDFFVDVALKIGNIHEATWAQMTNSFLYHRFGDKKSDFSAACGDCFCFMLCAGDCLKHRLNGSHGASQYSRLCAGWKQFYQKALPGFSELAKQIRGGNPPEPSPL